VSAQGDGAERSSTTRPGIRPAVFSYVTESPDYRHILAVFAGTFFAELTPSEVTARLAEAGTALEETTVGQRLEQLRDWGNLEVSASIGQVGTVEDYYRRRNRYLITRVGQEVHDLVEGVLAQVDDVRDVSLGRLEQLRSALEALTRLDAASAPPDRLAEAVRAVFDPHVAFSAEITQFFAAINQWQSRFDLDEDEFAFFSEVLVGYVGERLETLRRAARPVASLLTEVGPVVGTIVERAADGLAARVAAAGLSSVRVRREPFDSSTGRRRGAQQLVCWRIAEHRLIVAVGAGVVVGSGDRRSVLVVAHRGGIDVIVVELVELTQ